MIRFASLEALGARAAAFSGKAEGDCGFGEPESRETCQAARSRFCTASGIDASHLVCARQVHGVQVARVEECDRGRGACEPESALPETDGLVTNVPGLPLAVLVADCAPVYLIDPKRPAIALVHAGRRGTRKNIGGAAVAFLHFQYGSNPSDMHAVIGPCIGKAVYEVSPEIAEDWQRAGLPREGPFLDLARANENQLLVAGIPPDHITSSRLCTLTDSRFYSYRAGDKTTRNMALLML